MTDAPDRNGWVIALIDDDAELAAAIQAGMCRDERFGRVECFESGEEFLSRGKRDDFDLALVDHGLPGIGGIELIAELARSSPELKTAIFTVNEARDEVLQAMHAGARGYLLKIGGLAQLIGGIEALIAGHVLLNPNLAVMTIPRPKVPQSFAAAGLTRREGEMLEMLAQGLSRKEIAHRMGLSLNTVCTHLKRLYVRLGVNSRMGALNRAAEIGLV